METVGKITVNILLFLLLAFIRTVPIWLLWNWLMPTILGLTEITFLQAVGISFLSGCLFQTTVRIKEN